MQRIVEALASKKAWAQDLVAYWDRVLFPDTDTPQSTVGAQHLEDAEDDDEAFFGSAPAVQSPVQSVFFSVKLLFLSLIVFFTFVLPPLRIVLCRTVTTLQAHLDPLAAITGDSDRVTVRPHPALPHRVTATMDANRPRCPADRIVPMCPLCQAVDLVCQLCSYLVVNAVNTV